MNVVIKSALAAMVLLASSVSVVNAAGAGTGSVTFSGEILESACSITPPECGSAGFAGFSFQVSAK